MIVIPMAGLSRRFFVAGYTKPKYQLPFNEGTVFSESVRTFKNYFDSDRFLFICRADYDTPEFVTNQLAGMGVKDFKIHVLSHETGGQAETVHLGLDGVAADEPLYIFNIDTFRYGFTKPRFASECDGYLEVFEGEGEHWSFVEPLADGKVKRTTEKDRISSLCSDGLYYFRHCAEFRALFTEAKSCGNTVNGEFYIAPLYNRLIERGGDVRYEVVDIGQIGFCGTPEEYEDLLRQKSGHR